MPTDVTPVSRTRRPIDADDAPPATGRPATPGRAPEPPSCSSQDRERDAVLAESCRNAPPSAWKRAPAAPTNDRLLYVGMNKDSAPKERDGLARSGVALTAITSSANPNVTFQGRAYDLSKAEGATEFAGAVGRAYGLDATKTAALSRALAHAPGEGRDELARIALVWAPAESGAAIPSRLILSGHSGGEFLFGGHGESAFFFRDVIALARALPAAAQQVEDIHLSGCFTETHVQEAATWRDAFPNLKTLWGYKQYAPGAPVWHMTDWEIATRGRVASFGESFVAAHAPATAWSLTGGIANAGKSLEERRALVTDADRSYDGFFSGARPIKTPHQPDADRAYAAYRMLAAHAGANPSERASATERAEHMLRLRFYEKGVRAEFAQKHGASINQAFDRLGLRRVDFGGLSRKDALAAIDAFRERAGPRPAPEVARAAALLTGLAELRSDVVQTSWCHE